MNFDKFSDEELKALMDSIYTDLNLASAMNKNSSWHEGAFAALFVVCEEMNRRKN